jgi:hypothetical protein
MQRLRQKFRGLNGWFIFSRALQPDAIATNSAQIFNIISRAHASFEERTQWDRF